MPRRNHFIIKFIFVLNNSDVARGGAEGAAAVPEILRNLKNYFNGL